MTGPHAAFRRDIDAHFAGRITPGDERTMREHLGQCAGCRRRYERRMLLAELDPGALDASERIGRGLGIGRRAPSMLTVAGALIAAAACFFLALLPHPRPLARTDEFATRGSRPIEPVSLEVYHARPGSSFELAGGSIGEGDELAFAYANQAAYPYLAVCGADEHGHVYWYHPAWTSFSQDPDSVRIEGGPRLRELPEAIQQNLDGRELRVVAVFSSNPLRVQDVERVLAAKRADRTLRVALSDAFGSVMVVERNFVVVP